MALERETRRKKGDREPGILPDPENNVGRALEAWNFDDVPDDNGDGELDFSDEAIGMTPEQSARLEAKRTELAKEQDERRRVAHEEYANRQQTPQTPAEKDLITLDRINGVIKGEGSHRDKLQRIFSITSPIFSGALRSREEPKPLRRLPIERLMTEDFPVIPPRVSDPQGRLLVSATDPLLIHGEERSGKTSLLLDLSLSLVTGRPLLGQFSIAAPCRTALLVGEGAKSDYRNRLRQLMRLRGLTFDDLKGLELICRDDQPHDYWVFIDVPDQVDNLIESLREDPPEVLIIDPLANFMVSEETNDGVKAVLQQVRRITKAIGCQIIISHHNIKNEGAYEQSRKRARGGGALAAGCGVLSLTSLKCDRGFRFRVESSPKEGQSVPPFEVQWTHSDLDDHDLPQLTNIEVKIQDGSGLKSLHHRLLRLLEESGPISSIRKIAGLLGPDGPSKSTVQREVKKLLGLSLIIETAAGYGINPDAQIPTPGQWVTAYETPDGAWDTHDEESSHTEWDSQDGEDS